MVLYLLISSVSQSLIALVWLNGIQRLGIGVVPAVQLRLSALALILPVLIPVAHIAKIANLPANVLIVRVGYWVQIIHNNRVVAVCVGLLFVGTAIIFVVQELVPFLQRLSSANLDRIRVADFKLDAILSNVRLAFAEKGIHLPPVKVYRLKVPEIIAVTYGKSHPALYFSDGALKLLDGEELEGVVAHELAHFHYSGYLKTFGMMCVRAVQAFNPFVLIGYRNYADTLEVACDDLAAKATENRPALVRAIIKLSEPIVASKCELAAGTGLMGLGIFEQGEVQATLYRIYVLKRGSDADEALLPYGPFVLTVLLGGILWAIA